MKPNTEMREGPEALQRFENTMKALFSKSKGGAVKKPSLKQKEPQAPKN